MGEYSGKIAVITGGGGGIAHGIEVACLKEGMKLVLADIHEQRLEAQKASLLQDFPSAEIITQKTDVSKEEDVQKLLDVTLQAFGKVNFLFNNAGVHFNRQFYHMTENDWKFILGVNVWGIINGLKVFIPEMEKNEDIAYIINTGALGSLAFVPAMSHYCATKAAALMISGSVLKELQMRGSKINIMVVMPHFISSGLLQNDLDVRPEEFKNDFDEREIMDEFEKAKQERMYAATVGAMNHPEDAEENRQKYGTIPNVEAGEIIMQHIKEGKNFCITHDTTKEAFLIFSKMLVDGYIQ